MISGCFAEGIFWKLKVKLGHSIFYTLNNSPIPNDDRRYIILNAIKHIERYGIIPKNSYAYLSSIYYTTTPKEIALGNSSFRFKESNIQCKKVYNNMHIAKCYSECLDYSFKYKHRNGNFVENFTRTMYQIFTPDETNRKILICFRLYVYSKFKYMTFDLGISSENIEMLLKENNV